MNSFLVIRSIHITCVALSLGGFVTRGILRAFNSRLLQTRFVRVIPHVIDTLLLVSGVRLAMLIGFAANANWLLTKLGALLVYVVLGSVALKHGSSRLICVASWLGAIVIFAFIVSVARTHLPLGFFARN